MSRIFDALQRSGTEQSGIEYPDMVSVATEVFEAQPGQAPANRAPADRVQADRATADRATAVQEPMMPVQEAQALITEALGTDALGPETAKEVLAEFPSLEVCVTPSSRLVFFTEPDSLAAEKFRFLGVRLRQLRQNRQLKKVLVTSTIPEEGKSLVSANLAGALARRKQKVLLIEGDMRRPTLAHHFGLGKLNGLSEWLQSGAQTPSNIYRLGGPGLWFLPAGDPPANPLELMQSGRLSQLMSQLADLFDWIIVDSPPILPLADTTVWARLTEGTLLVAREGKTQKSALQRGLAILKKSDLLGVVLNGSTQSESDYYQRYAPPGTK
jgi:capsular exopolysaccharide synthesis family protein